MEEVVEVIEQPLVALANATGLRWGPTTREQFFYKRPIIHIIEVPLYLLLFYGFLALSRNYFADNVTKHAAREKPKYLMDQVIGYFMLFLWGFQIVLKCLHSMPLVHLCWMIMPCHVFTVLWGYILTCAPEKKNYNLCVYLATMMLGMHWGPLAAGLWPAIDDHEMWIEWPFFVVHHGFLIALPVYWGIRHEYLPLSLKFLWHITGAAGFVTSAIHHPMCWVTGLNLVVHLHLPAPLQQTALLGHQFFLPVVFFILMICVVCLHTCCIFLCGAIKLIFSCVFGGTVFNSSDRRKNQSEAKGEKRLKRNGAHERKGTSVVQRCFSIQS